MSLLMSPAIRILLIRIIVGIRLISFVVGIVLICPVVQLFLRVCFTRNLTHALLLSEPKKTTHFALCVDYHHPERQLYTQQNKTEWNNQFRLDFVV